MTWRARGSGTLAEVGGPSRQEAEPNYGFERCFASIPHHHHHHPLLSPPSLLSLLTPRLSQNRSDPTVAIKREPQKAGFAIGTPLSKLFFFLPPPRYDSQTIRRQTLLASLFFRPSASNLLMLAVPACHNTWPGVSANQNAQHIPHSSLSSLRSASLTAKRMSFDLLIGQFFFLLPLFFFFNSHS